MLDGAAQVVAGVHHISALLVRALDRVHRVDDGDFVHDFSGFGQVVADHDVVGAGGDGFGFAHDFFFLGLRIEGVDVAHAAGHEQINDVLGLGNLCCAGGSGFGNADTDHGEQVNAEISAGRIGQKLSASEFVGLVERIHSKIVGYGWAIIIGGTGIPKT